MVRVAARVAGRAFGLEALEFLDLRPAGGVNAALEAAWPAWGRSFIALDEGG